MDQFQTALSTFENEFKTILKENESHRDFNLIKKGENGVLSSFVSKNEKFCFSCVYNEDQIDIYYDKSEIKKNYLDKNLSKEEIQSDFSYLAFHEYGHSTFCISTQKLKKEWENQGLINIFQNFNWFIIARGFTEFFADYKAKNLGCKSPESFLRECIKLVKHQHGWYSEMVLPNRSFHSYETWRKDQWMNATLNNFKRFYIWEKWSQLEPLFQKYKVEGLLEFFKIVFSQFEEFCKNHDDLNKTRLSLISLFTFIDKQNYDQLVFQNFFSEELKTSLRNQV